MTINGVEFEIDFTDADFIEKYDYKLKDVEKQIEELRSKKNTLKPAEGIRQECKIIKEFLDYVLGDGTSEKIFGGKDSLNLCLKAFEDIIDNFDKQQQDMQERINKYSPERIKR
jgi:hypothetical protein